MDYGFTHNDRVFTPNGTQGIDPASNADRNRAIEAEELARWAERPETMIAYYHFEQTAHSAGESAQLWRSAFQLAVPGHVSTWLGQRIGTITSARVYTVGGRFVAITVRGTNGAVYYGRASWDNGNVIRLRKAKARS